MKWVKIYEDYNEIKKMCDQWGAMQIDCIRHLKNWTLNSNGLIDVNGDVNLSYKKLTKLPLNFGTIEGDFWCFNNQLTSLEGSPTVVRGGFYCYNNRLTSLEYSPKTVTGNFDCTWNQIRSFEGAPMYVDGNFWCEDNPIFPIWYLFRDWSKVEFLNDCDAIQDRNIIMVRLNYFLGEIGKGECDEETIRDLKSRGYKIIY